MPQTKATGLRERLQKKETILAAEGYLFEAERRGYLQAGPFVPIFIKDNPEYLRCLYEEFAKCGSDVVLAFTYYGHRAKLRLIGQENLVEPINRKALQIARQVADEYGLLMAGNISNSTIYEATPEKEKEVYEMFKEQIIWAVEEGADYIVAETYMDSREANLAMKVMKEFGNGLPTVVMLNPGGSGFTADGVEIGAACRKLEEMGADIVGLNCGLGPEPILPLMKRIREACKGPLACLPVPYRCTHEAPTMFELKDPKTGVPAFPLDLDMWLNSRSQVHTFAEECKKMGIEYVGLCCGARPVFIREMATVYGRKPIANKYEADMSKHMSRVSHNKTLEMAKHIGMPC